jgi:predicted dehydrogenase
MSENTKTTASRREFVRTAGAAATASVLAGISLPRAYAAEDSVIRLALIGCGGRGSGAVNDAMGSTAAPTKLYAMADLFQNRLDSSHAGLSKGKQERVEVPPERRFVGFDAYRKAIDCLRPGDVAICSTHSAFRPTHVEYAVEKGINVFMEKSFAPDPAGTQRILRAGEAAEKKNLKIGVGVMCRHSTARQALIQKIREGAMGDIQLLRAYRMHGWGGPPYKPPENELLWQIRHPYNMLWVSSGWFIDWVIHNIDECCWVKDAWPVSAMGMGGRAPNSNDPTQNFDTYNVEYTFADGSKALVCGRYAANCHNDFATYIHGSKCAAQFSGNVHQPTVRMYKDQRMADDNIAWQPEGEKTSPYRSEWNALLEAIRMDKPHNEVKRGANTNYTCLMGRAAVHTGRIVTWEQITSSKFAFVPKIDELTVDSPPPVKADAQGRYPVPTPGSWTEV